MHRTPGQIAFEAYNNTGPTPGLTYDGKPIPPWGEIAPHTRERWEEAAKAAGRARLDQFGQDRPGIAEAFARSLTIFEESCRAHNGPLAVRVLLEDFERELSDPSSRPQS